MFAKDCRQLQQWIDNKEIQMLVKMDEIAEPEEQKKLNKEL